MYKSSQHTISLRDYSNIKTLGLTDSIEIFVDIVKAVQFFHARNIVHNDINADNIRLDLNTRAVTLMSSEMSLTISEKTHATVNAKRNDGRIQGQIAYISPEQTGRTAHPIDYRSDYYSLGVIFYQLLTGTLPFDFPEPVQTIHAHIAVAPVPVNHVNTKIPEVLARITAKLLAKSAIERYQSSAGLISDLEMCLHQLKTDGKIKTFPIAQNDMSPIFAIPRKLYGRYKEIQLLLDTYQHVQKGGSGILFFNGPPGIGKSFLVKEVRSYLSDVEGYFICGKFDQFEKNIPCRAIVQAFTGLIRKMLTLNEKELKKKRRAILETVGANGQLIIDVIPELQLIIGEQPKPEKLSPLEEQNRFNFVFQKFVRSLTDMSHPIIFFLDDLHWADITSLHLMEAVLLDIELRNVFFIGCYRDIEAKKNPFLKQFLERIRQKKTESNFITLGPVDDEYIEMLINDMLAIDMDKKNAFIDLIAAKTNRNPLFIKEFIVTLYEEGIIRFMQTKDDAGPNRWHIDLEGALSIGLPDTIVALLTKRIRNLSNTTQVSLNIAACIGTQFSTELIASVYKKPIKDISIHLKQALDQGMLIRVNDGFRFIHDRVREAAYLLNTPDKRVKIHYAIGKNLMSGILNSEPDDIFMIASQLNSARELLSDDERNELIRLNLTAGQKAKRLTAYHTALEYLNAGLDLFSEDAWNIQYDLALALHTETAETAYLCTDIDYALKLVHTVTQYAHSYLDQVSAYEIKFRCLVSQSKFSDVINEGILFLNDLDYSVPRNPGKLRFLWEFTTLRYMLWRRKSENLHNMPETQDLKVLARSNIIDIISIAMYSVQTELLQFIVIKGLKAALKRRSATPEIPSIFATYGLWLIEKGNIDSGYRFGQLGLFLTKRSHTNVSVYICVNGIMMYWKHHIRETLQPLMDTYNLCMESGNIETAAQAVSFYCSYSFTAGIPLHDVLSQITYFYEIMLQNGQKLAIKHLRMTYRLVLELIGPSESPRNHHIAVFDQNNALQQYVSSSDTLALSSFYYYKVIVDYLSGNFLGAIKNAMAVRKHLKSGSSIIKPHLYYYDSLARLALLQKYSAEMDTNERNSWNTFRSLMSKRYHLKIVAANQKALKKYTQHAPMNFMNKSILIEAERAAVYGKKKKAEEYYHQAIELSRKHQFLQDEAISNTLLARFYLSCDDKKRASKYFQAAIELTNKWGAKERSNRLLKEYNALIQADPEIKGSVLPPNTVAVPDSPTALNLAEMDLQLFSETMDSISNKSDVSNYLLQLSENIMKYAGAQHVLLLINRNTLSIGVDNQLGKKPNILAPIQTETIFPVTLVKYVMRTRETVLMDNAIKSEMFSTDPYIKDRKVKSVICMPLLYQNRLTALLYLENNLNCGVFTRQHQKMLKGLCGQIALFFENECLKESHMIDYNSPISSELFTKILQENYGLTPQEAKIASLFKEGHTRTKICEILSISATTLKKHLQTIYDKTINSETDMKNEGRVDKLSRLIFFLFKLTKSPRHS